MKFKTDSGSFEKKTLLKNLIWRDEENWMENEKKTYLPRPTTK